MNCHVTSGSGGPKNYEIVLSASASDGRSDCDSTHCPDGACSSGEQNLCRDTWRAPQKYMLHREVPASWALWKALITLPPDVSVLKTERAGDAGYDVDLKVNPTTIEASVW